MCTSSCKVFANAVTQFFRCLIFFPLKSELLEMYLLLLAGAEVSYCDAISAVFWVRALQILVEELCLPVHLQPPRNCNGVSWSNEEKQGSWCPTQRLSAQLPASPWRQFNHDSRHLPTVDPSRLDTPRWIRWQNVARKCPVRLSALNTSSMLPLPRAQKDPLEIQTEANMPRQHQVLEQGLPFVFSNATHFGS